MDPAPAATYVVLAGRYGDEAFPSTDGDFAALDAFLPLYERGILHDVGPLVRDVAGRIGLRVDAAPDAGRAPTREALARAAAATGLDVAFVRDPDPPYHPRIETFLPIADPRARAPDAVVEAVNAAALAAVAHPGEPMPDGTSVEGVHAALRIALEEVAVALIYGRPDAQAAAAGTRGAWETLSALRGTDLASTVSHVAGPVAEALSRIVGGTRGAPAPTLDRPAAETLRKSLADAIRGAALAGSLGERIAGPCLTLAALRGEDVAYALDVELGGDLAGAVARAAGIAPAPGPGR